MQEAFSIPTWHKANQHGKYSQAQKPFRCHSRERDLITVTNYMKDHYKKAANKFFFSIDIMNNEFQPEQ